MTESRSKLMIVVLDICSLVKLQQTSRRFLSITRDEQLWKSICFEGSPAERLRQRIIAIQKVVTEAPNKQDGARNPSHRNKYCRNVQALANWDPSFPTEKVSWYQEYIHRHGPISSSWLQKPFEGLGKGRCREARGLGALTGLAREDGSDTVVVSPLDDGSVCLWDLRGSGRGGKNKQGGILAISRPGLLSVSGEHTGREQARAAMTSTGVVECVSVDNLQKRAFFAVQSGLNEVDLQTLQVISHTKFPFSISALSATQNRVPLTVGTTLSLHLHDTRTRGTSGISNSSMGERCDLVANFPTSNRQHSVFRTLFDGRSEIATYAPLFQPGPLSILHSHSSEDFWDGDGDIYVAGRFPSILRYDRRMWPKLRGTIHSGARLCGLAALPYTVMPQDCASAEELIAFVKNKAEAKPSTMLIACGEYNGKGSLELHGTSADCSRPSSPRPRYPSFKNRRTASASKLLSVATHGTRIVVSDGDGMVKWLERDGSLEVRRWHLNEGQEGESGGLFARTPITALNHEFGGVVRKILSTNGSCDKKRLNQDDLLLWTGERIGLLSFTRSPQFLPADFDERVETAEELLKRREEKHYNQAMRLALESQADGVRLMRGLGGNRDVTRSLDH
ncbi:hypothetical protein FGG08_003817 [Glutinoglossum americanum]|uniref:F-box domain-containing protein n=1 Tax=Glutinoglossum americanum TaxID=1670608 RepID=A0A9P8I1Q6_9PEZI|nr:hypothetical protein FGG08_003817 [Glutinoglossum americanum]